MWTADEWAAIAREKLEYRPMNEMFERVVSSIMDADGPRDAACAALASMEQPSQTMIEAAHALPDGSTAEEVWRAMITAAAKESSD